MKKNYSPAFTAALLFVICFIPHLSGRLFGCSNVRLFCIWLLLANCLLLRRSPILFLLFVIGPTANSFAQCGWTQKADFGGTARSGAVGFSIGTKGYIGTGYDGASKQDFWEWDQATNVWTQKATLI